MKNTFFIRLLNDLRRENAGLYKAIDEQNWESCIKKLEDRGKCIASLSSRIVEMDYEQQNALGAEFKALQESDKVYLDITEAEQAKNIIELKKIKTIEKAKEAYSRYGKK